MTRDQLVDKIATSKLAIALFRSAVGGMMAAIVAGGGWLWNRIDETHTLVKQLAATVPLDIQYLHAQDVTHDVRLGNVETRLHDMEMGIRRPLTDRAQIPTSAPALPLVTPLPAAPNPDGG